MANRPAPPARPQAPVDLLAVAVGDRQVILAWTECGTSGLGFHVERADGFGSACVFSEIGGVGPRVTAFRDGSVKPRTSYTYRVRAADTAGSSPPSAVAEVTTPPAGRDVSADPV